MLVAAGDIEVVALNNHSLVSTARSAGGGAIAGKIAYTHVDIDNDVNVDVGANANLTARGDVVLNADSQTTAETISDTYVVAVGAGADSDNTNSSTRGIRIGTAADTAERGVTIAGGVQITGATVDLLAQVSWLNLLARADATSYSPVFFGVTTAFADAYIDVYSNVFVNVFNGTTRTTITGTAGVDIEARHTGGLMIDRDTDVLSVSLIPPQEGRARGTDQLDNTVDVDRGVLVVVGARTVTDRNTSVAVATDFITVANHGFVDGDRVKLGGAMTQRILGVLVVPVALDVPYYVVEATANTFKLSQTYGGAPIDFATASAVTIRRDRLAPSFDSLKLSLYGAAENGFINLKRTADGVNYNNSTSTRSGAIQWDADVVVLGGLQGSPLLVIDADGIVVESRAIQVVNAVGALVTPVVGQAVPLDGSGGITIAPIQNTGYADVAFVADNAVVNEDYVNTAGNATAVADLRVP